MTRLLEQAVKNAQSLPDSEQDAIGSLIIEELEDEAKWGKIFSSVRNLNAGLPLQMGYTPDL